MSKRMRQIAGIFAAIVAYYLIHEGAHLLYAVCAGAFRQIRWMGLGVQVDVYAERMTETQLGVFCLVGALATLCPEWAARVLAGALLLANGLLFLKRVLPLYRQSFAGEE